MEELLIKLLGERKTDDEIVTAILSDEATKDMKADEILDAILAAKKTAEVKKGLEKDTEAKEEVAAKAKAEKEADEKISKLVNEKFKSIGINPLGQFGKEKELKRFDLQTGKVIDVVPCSDMYGHANDMIRCMMKKDFASAQAISDEISTENAKIRDGRLKKLGFKATPSVSDVTTRGGYAIPTEVDDMITQMVYDSSVMLQNANKETIIVNDKVYPLMYGLEVAYIADQSTGPAEKNPTFYNPTVATKQVGGWSAISNRLLNQKGADLMNAFILAYRSAMARFLDHQMAVGCVTGMSDLLDGIAFDPLTVQDTAITLGELAISHLSTMASTINGECERLMWICNRKVKHAIGLLENTGGNNLFPQFIGGGNFSPLGISLIENSKITSDLDIAGDDRDDNNDILLLVDMNKFMVGFDGETRIDVSSDYLFGVDMTAIRGVRAVGWKVLAGNTQAAGGVARVLELTTA